MNEQTYITARTRSLIAYAEGVKKHAEGVLAANPNSEWSRAWAEGARCAATLILNEMNHPYYGVAAIEQQVASMTRGNI